jgi:hypothetical protein
MVEDVPGVHRFTPDSCSACQAVSLPEDICHKVGIRAKVSNGVVPALPSQRISEDGRFAGKLSKYELATISSP